MPGRLALLHHMTRLGRPLPRALAIGVLLCSSAVSSVLYARYVNEFYALRDWLAWPLLAIWGYTALCNLAWFSLGSLITGRVLRLVDLPHLERAVLSTGIGVVAFTELMYVAGALGLYGPVFALALALAMSLAGGPELVRWWRSYRDEPAPRQPAGPRLFVLWGLGGALTFVLYLGLFSPDAVNYDASWCHLTVAQDYAREGRIVPFPGDYTKNVPQLAALLRTWDFSVPGLGEPALRWMLSLHQEFALFLWTLAGVAAATRFMLRDQHVRGAWVAFYLFPIIFVYDHNLGGAADHIVAFFTLPALVAAGRLLERLDVRRAAALVACMAGGFLTKYQAFYWILPIALVVGVRWGLQLRQLRQLRVAPRSSEDRRPLWWLPIWMGCGFTLLVLPHFLRNWVFYQNPLYPFAQQVFTGTRPSVDAASFLFSNVFVDLRWVPQGSFWPRFVRALRLAFTFSFKPHYSFTGDAPVFGSLFTLLLPALLCVRERLYALLGAFVGLFALTLWGYTFNVDRNLQIFMPILVATTAALLVGVLQLGWLARLAIAPIVLFQIVWGADAVFYSSKDRIDAALNLIVTGFNGGGQTRFDRYRAPYLQVGRALPRDAKVLLHMSHISLGVDRELVLDWAGFQGLISYSRLHDMSELAELYRRHGITHLLYTPGERPDSSIQGEVLFQSLVRWLGQPLLVAGGLRLLRLPEVLPPVEPAYKVLTFDLFGYGSGVFPIDRLNTIEYLPADKLWYSAPEAPVPADAAGLEALNADAVVVGASAKLNRPQQAFLAQRFVAAVAYGQKYTVYLRREVAGR
ncbi:MAG: hypothetical protein ABI895_17385 [Deltaproteobacteria bacterium]